jgi:hypothetical protein
MTRRTILINSQTRTLTEDVLPPGPSLDYLQAQCGGYIQGGGEVVPGVDLFVDEEGLLKHPEYFFFLQGVGQEVFAGNGIIVGVDDEGETVGTDLSLDAVRARLRWLSPSEAWAIARQLDEHMKATLRERGFLND